MTSGGADSGPNAGSNLVQGVGTNSATFTLPGSPRYKVESVVASVNNAAGGDTTGTLTVADQSGQVVAAVEQGRVLTAGVTGRATWALRLTGEQSALADRRAYARFVGSELAADATKVLVPAVAGTVIIPLDWYVVPSLDYSPSGGQPFLNLRTPTWSWDSVQVSSFGVTYYNTATIYTSAPSTNGVPLSVAGEPLQVVADASGATSAVGHIEVFVRYYTVAVRP